MSGIYWPREGAPSALDTANARIAVLEAALRAAAEALDDAAGFLLARYGPSDGDFACAAARHARDAARHAADGGGTP